MLKFLSTAVFLLAIAQGRAQTPTPPPKDTDKIFTKVEIESAYPGGNSRWESFVASKLRYPREARRNEIQGNVVVQFLVDMQGNVSDIKTVDGPTTGGLPEEAIRLVRISGKWTPAIQNGRQVNSFKKVIINFKLND
jgi:periplasmic protein TonB